MSTIRRQELPDSRMAPAPNNAVRTPSLIDCATLTVTEAAGVLGISRSTAYELVRAGTVPSLRLGRRIVVPRHALADLLQSTVAPT